MGHVFKRLAASLALACVFCLVFALPATAWAEEYTIILTTETGDTSQGYVQCEKMDTWGVLTRTHASESVEVKLTTDASSKYYQTYQTIYATPKTGYRFVAWVNLHDGSVYSTVESTVIYLKDYSPEQPIELQARFEALAEYTLHLIIEGADGRTPVTVAYHDYYQSTDITFYEGTKNRISVGDSAACEFDAASSVPDAILASEYARTFSFVMPSSDVTVTIRFRSPSCVVTFDGIDIWADRRILVERGEHTTYTLPECPITKEGMVFCGWSVGMPGDTIGLLGDLKIYPIWRPEELPEGRHMLLVRSSYPLAYTRVNGEDQNYSNYSAHVTPLYFSPGDEISLAISGDPAYMEPFGVSIEGVEWPDGQDVQDLVSAYWTLDEEKYWHFTMPDNDVNITFLMRPKSSEIKFDANGGTGSMEPIKTEVSGIFTLPECTFTPPEGKVFDTWGIPYYGGYWQTYNPGTKSYTGAYSDMPKGTFYALWKDAAPCTHAQLEVVPGTDATCEKDGTEAFWKCTQCGKMFADQKAEHEIYAPVEIPGGHDWGEWVVTKEPTSTTEGEETRTCKRDPSHKETREIPMVEMPATYEFSFGVGQAWAQGSTVELRFIVKRSVDDDTTMAHFMKVTVDGTPVPPLGYDIQAGSVEILLKPAYLESLALGEHRLVVTFDDGSAETTFTVVEEGSIVPEPTGGEGEGSGLPVWAWILIGAGGAAAIAFAVLRLPAWIRKQQRAKRRKARQQARTQAEPSASPAETAPIVESYRRALGPDPDTEETRVLERVHTEEGGTRTVATHSHTQATRTTEVHRRR